MEQDQAKAPAGASSTGGEGGGSAAEQQEPPSYMETHDLVYAKDKKRSKVKTHREVETVLLIHSWKPATEAPVNGWMDYCFQPANSTEEIQPLAGLPAPSLAPAFAFAFDIDFDESPARRTPPPSPDDWKLAYFNASLEVVRQFAARVNTVSGDEIFVVQEKPFYWIKAQSDALEAAMDRKISL